MEDFKATVYGIFTGLQACSYCLETEALYYLNAIKDYLEKHEQKSIPFDFLTCIEEYCPGFLTYLKKYKYTFDTKTVTDSITHFSIPEFGEIQVIYE